MAKLVRAVILRDPNRARDLTFQPGDEPDLEYAVLITNPHCWEGGKLPTAVRRAQAAKEKDREQQTPAASADSSDGPDGSGKDDDASGDDSSTDTGDEADEATPPAKKTAARKTAATKPARGRDAADEGSSGD